MSAPTDVMDFVADPIEYFDWSMTRLWTMPYDQQRLYQRAGLMLRFEQFRETIPYLKKLADRDGIDQIRDIDDIVPLLFEHTVYKSYPASLLENSKFSAINGWLQKLTTESVSHVDVSQCASIDEWLDVMDAETRLTIHHSSGTTGTVSLFPKTKTEVSKFGKLYPLRFQKFGDPRPEVTQPKAHVIIPSFRSGGSAHFRINEQYFKRVAHEDEAFMHVAFEGRMSADVLYLAGRIRASKARGDLDRLVIPANLLTRLEQFEASHAQRSEKMSAFLEEVTERLSGQRVFMACAPTYLWPLAEKALARGRHHVFANDSVISTGGGAKGMVLPGDWKEKVMMFAGVSEIPQNFAMTEMNANNMLCANGRYHIAPWIVPFLLDPDTSQILPRTGTVTGRLAFYDLLADTHWGGFISGDEVTITWDKPCGCGRTGPHLHSEINRYSEMRGGDDKISCAASAEAHEEAMDFLAQSYAGAA